jgi:outer membrane protein OmpA-like peptidoglycan-associated protein
MSFYHRRLGPNDRFAILGVTIVLFGLVGGLSGCATKGFVRKEVSTVQGRVDRVEASADQAGREARDAHSLARTGDERAQQAMTQAELAKEIGLGHVRREEVRNATVYFDFDSATLNEEGEQALDEIAQELASNPNYLVIISGFTDATGDQQYNLTLGQRRASAVNLYLAEKIGPEFVRLAYMGFGEINPAADNDSREGRKQNRRVEVSVVRPVPVSSSEGAVSSAF